MFWHQRETKGSQNNLESKNTMKVKTSITRLSRQTERIYNHGTICKESESENRARESQNQSEG